jgi:peroxiredoxin
MGTEVKLEVGHEAPRFSLPASDGSTVSLNDYLGKKKRLSSIFTPKTILPAAPKKLVHFAIGERR